tara:strand:+ start:217 stop:567 length:351 start_codon:yes stop_codon:yes gene_type:complete
MDTPIWLKPALYGAGAGAVALAIVGFAWGGWMTSNTAQQMASSQARLQVVAALVPICIEQSQQDPELTQTLTMLKAANAYERSDMVMKAGWATMPGSNDPNRSVARACMDQLAAQF